MKFKLYTNSKATWDAMLSQIKKAQTSIYLEMFIFTDDMDAQYNFVSLLSQKAREGLQVILLLDTYGSKKLSAATVAKLRASGIEVRFIRHLVQRTHRKLLILDGTIAFVGGVNITDHAKEWADLQLEIHGGAVRRFVFVFARTYKQTGGKQILSSFKLQGKSLVSELEFRILDHAPLWKRNRLKYYYLEKLAETKQSITFLSPYFVPSRWLISAMRDALTRGVQIKIIVPDSTDFAFLDNINRHYAKRATDLGAEVFFYPGMNHEKAVLIDETEGMVGSGNIDELSFWLNSELGVFFTDRQIVQKLSHVLRGWESKSAPFKPSQHGLKWYQYLLIPLIKILHPLL